jgi:hypothetical protein
MTIPYIGFGNEQLKDRPDVLKGDIIECFQCGDGHPLEHGTDETGKETNTVGFIVCTKTNTPYMVSINGKSINGLKPKSSGKMFNAIKPEDI